jgi:hypothetical protein
MSLVLPDPGDGDRLLSRRRRRGVLREVFLLADGERVLKRFHVPRGVWRYDRSWRREHEALSRLAGTAFPETFGYSEERGADGLSVKFLRRFVPGEPVAEYADADIRDLAELLALLHGRGIVTDDVHRGNVIRCPDGSLTYIDFGCARLYRPGSARLYWRAGDEAYETFRLILRRDPDAWRVFRERYGARIGAGGWRGVLVGAGFRAARVLRWIRKESRMGRRYQAWRKRGRPADDAGEAAPPQHP